jgi:hypothetical protein
MKVVMSRFTRQPNIDQYDLHRLLHYNPETGIFVWRKPLSKQVSPGDRAGSLCRPRGYWQISIKGKNYPAHRLAWLYIHGEWSTPERHIDHKNRDKLDNRIANLR